MNEGRSHSLYILWWDGSYKEVWAWPKVEVHLIGTPLKNTDDPDWYLKDYGPDKKPTGHEAHGEEITFRQADGSHWIAKKLHCEYVGSLLHFKTWFEIRRTVPQNHDLQNHDTQEITVLDWEGRPFLVSAAVDKSGDQVVFNISKLPGPAVR